MSINKLIRGLSILFVLVLIIDPSNKMLGLKTVVFVVLVAVLVIGSVGFKTSKNLYYLVILAVLPTVLVFISVTIGVLWGSDLDFHYISGQLKSFSLLVLIPLFYLNKIDISKYVFNISVFVALISIISYATVLVGWHGAYEYIYDFLVRKTENGIFSFNRNFAGINMHSMFYKTSTILLLSMGHFSYRFTRTRLNKYLFLAIICLLGLLATGTRASILGGIAMAGLLIYPWLRRLMGKLIKPVLYFFTLVVLIGLTFKLLSNKNEYSLQIKSNNFYSYIEEIRNPRTFFLGDGVGSYFFAGGQNQEVTHTELTYFDLIRGYGFFLTIVLLIVFVAPLFFLSKNKDYGDNFALSYVLYLIVAGTNPLLISSTGMLIVISAYTFLFRNSRY